MSALPQLTTGGPPFLLVTGGKGGVGKTTVAANLGVALGGLGERPLVCDLDFGLANLDVVLGIRPERSVEDFLAGEATFEGCCAEAPGGLRVLTARSGSYERGRPDRRRRQRLRDAFGRSSASIVVGDSPAGIGDDVLDFAVQADRVLVVTTPEPAAVTDAYGVIKAVDQFALDQGREVPTPEVFVNLAADASEARAIAAKLAGVCERFLARSPRLVGWLPRSREVLRGVVSQRPFVLDDSGSPAAENLGRLARRYADLDPVRTLEQGPWGVENASKASLGHGR